MKQAGGKTTDLTFSQKQEVLNTDYDLKNGNNPYYQWGRKDPMLPGDGITPGIGKDKTCYTTDANYKFKYGSEGLNTSDIKEYIRNPHKFNIKEEMDNRYYNLWSTDNDKTVPNDEVVIKSVYDSSPIGYSLPAVNAFTGFTTTGQQVGNWTIPVTSEQVNAKFPFDKGWYFYTKPRKTGNTSFFYASGFRNHNSGRFNDLSSVGGCWVAGPYHAEFGHSLYLGARSIVHPINYFYNSFGWSVRSAEEKVLKCGLKKLQMMFRLRRFIMRRLEGVARKDCVSHDSINGGDPCFAWGG